MLLLKSNILTFTRLNCSLPRVVVPRNTAIRFFTSTFVNQKSQSSSNQSRTSIYIKKDDIATDSHDPFVTKTPSSTSGHTLSFMPVVNIPQTEFAHSTFFSLHRPLFGLTGDQELSFFSNQPMEEKNVDEQITNYMAHLQPFEPPAPPGTTKNQDKGDDSTMNSSNNNTNSMIEMEENYYLEQLPMYYMPESHELVEYLSSVQERLIRQSAYDHVTVASTLGRIKRRQSSSSSSKLLSPASTSTCVSLASPSRYRKWNRQGLYRHRWNK